MGTPTTRTTPPPPHTRPDYRALAASGLTDMDIPSGTQNLPGAMFLFAMGQLQAAKTQHELQATWGRYARWWKKRLDREAWVLVEARCVERAKELLAEVASNSGGANEGGMRQIETLKTMGWRPHGGARSG